MLLDVDQVILDYSGKEFHENEQPGSPVLTLKLVFHNVLNSYTNDELQKGVPAEDKLRWFRISSKVMGGGEVNLGLEEAALIKTRVGLIYGPLVYGRVCELLDPEEPEED